MDNQPADTATKDVNSPLLSSHHLPIAPPTRITLKVNLGIFNFIELMEKLRLEEGDAVGINAK